MAFIKRGDAPQTKASTAPAFSGKPGLPPRVAKYTLRMLPAGAEKGEDGKLPWLYLGIIWEQENTSQKDGSKYKTYQGSTIVQEDDPDKREDRFKLEVIGGTPILTIQEGKRVKDFSNKPNKAKDGCKWEPIGEKRTLCELAKGTYQPFEGVGEDGTQFQLMTYISKADRAAGVRSSGSGQRVNASDIFG